MNKNLLLIIGMFLLIFIPFASGAEWDNVMNYDEDTNTITIVNNLGLGSDLIEAQLMENVCLDGRYCKAVKTIELFEEGVLIQDFQTLRIDDDSWDEEEIRNHRFEYWGTINDYETQCYDGEEVVNESGSYTPIICEQVLIGNHEGLIRFNEGDIFQAGIYQVTTSGEIKPGKVYDWQIKIEGKWTTPWATWGNISLGDDAEVLLNSPVDDFTSLYNEVEFNCSANVTGGATLTNISLFTNESGTWEVKNTTLIETGVEGLVSYYNLDETSGPVIDSVGSNDGINTGATPNVDGIINTAYYFDGVFNRIDLGNPDIDLSTDFTWNIWFNASSLPVTSYLLTQGSTTSNNPVMTIRNSNDKLRWFVRDGNLDTADITGTTSVSINEWHMVTVTWDASTKTVELFLDGESEGTDTNAAVDIQSFDTFHIGVIERLTFSNFWNGTLDEVSMFNESLTDGQILNLYNSGAGQRPALSTSTQKWNRTLTDTTLWNCQACDSDGDCGFAIENRTLSIDTSVPQINITSLNETLEYGVIGLNETLNWTVTDINLDSCWYNYNGTNVSVVCNENTTNFILEEDNFNLTFYANDSLGTESSNFTNWSYNILETNVTFLPNITESESDFFQYFFQTTYLIESVKFNFGNTSYTASIFANGTNAWRLESTIQAPNVLISTDINFSFGIKTDFNGLVTSNNKTQTVLPLNVDNCSVFSNLIITAELFDERTIENITGTIEANLQLTNPSDGSLVSSFTTNFENVHNFSVCTDVNLTEKDFLYDLELRYYQNATGSNFNYVPEFYHIQKAATSTFPINIDLYDLNVNESTEFTIEYRDDNYVKRPNVLLQILRRYVNEGLSRTIEIPITSSEGTAVAHFDLNNYKYKIIVTEDGEVLNVFDNPAIRCESEISGICTINLKGLKGVPLAQGISEIIDFVYFPTQTATNISILFSSPSGSNKNVRVEMIQDSPFTDPITLCNTTLFTSSGEIVCDTDDSIGDSSVVVNVFVDGVTAANLGTTVQEDLSEAWEGNNYFIGAMLLLLLLGFSISSPQVMIWMGVFGLVLLGFLFLLNTANIGLFFGAITWLIVAATLVTIKINKRVES